MRPALLSACFFLGMLTLACSKKVATKFADCNAGAEVQWTGADICSQESDTGHYNNPAVKVAADNNKCKGIRIKHTKDMRLDLLLRRENDTKSCPIDPFDKHFPFDSGPQHVKEFATGVVNDRNAIGCGYEIHLTEKDNPGKCDPHIDISADGT